MPTFADDILTQTNNIVKDSTLSNLEEAVQVFKEAPATDWIPMLLKNYLVPLGIRVIAAVLVFIVCRWAIELIRNAVERRMERRQTDVSLRSFLSSLIRVVLNFIMIIFVIGILGINTSSLVALLASAGLAVGMALSGTLQNFAGGVMIVLFKPFKVGDFIEAQGTSGTVKDIQIFNTILLTVDNKTVIVPNGPLSTNIMTNYSTAESRRVDWTFTISYGDDFDKARRVLLQLCEDEERILKQPAVAIGLNRMTDNAVEISTKAWVKSADYWNVYFCMNEKVYKTFRQEGLNIPFPQMDVHIKN
ncbi:MAG: mechanosensitive ion channel family protein [Candidatus Limimorpha sp.]